MAYTTINKSGDYFNTVTYTGNTTAPRTISGVGFQPDWNWTKNRSYAQNHWLADAVRGSTKIIRSDGTNVEITAPSNGSISSFNADGYVLQAGSSADENYNRENDNYVAWNWKANGAGSTNTDGSITTTVSANTTAGFSIVKFTGNGSTSATMGHGLGAIPKIIFQKRLDSSSAGDWQVSFKDVGRGYLNWGNALQLNNSSSGNISYDANTTAYYKYGTTSDVSAVNVNGASYIAYCFADVTGYSKFGRYDGNGNADGNFVYTGFKPSWIMVKRYDSAGEWLIYDNKRDPHNLVDTRLEAQDNFADSTSSTKSLDFLSNGFKMRGVDNAQSNWDGNTYIYMAFAESPLVGSNNVPCTAR